MVAPLLEQARKYCVTYGIPFFSCCCVADNGAESSYENIMVSPTALHIKLCNNQIAGHINVANGFDTVLPHSGEGFSLEGDFDSLNSLDGEESMYELDKTERGE